MGILNRYQAHARHAARHEAQGRIAQEQDPEPLFGRCGICGQYHRFPEIRYRCECGYRRCSRGVDEWGSTCPECGREVRMETADDWGSDDDE